jgi:hypothetical protein
VILGQPGREFARNPSVIKGANRVELRQTCGNLKRDRKVFFKG